VFSPCAAERRRISSPYQPCARQTLSFPSSPTFSSPGSHMREADVFSLRRSTVGFCLHPTAARSPALRRFFFLFLFRRVLCRSVFVFSFSQPLRTILPVPFFGKLETVHFFLRTSQLRTVIASPQSLLLWLERQSAEFFSDFSPGFGSEGHALFSACT